MSLSDNSAPKSAPLVSIVVPVYNAERTLRHCVESALAQSYKNLELLLVNDGSTDLSGKLCDGLAANDARIRVFHRANGGPSAARNLGIEEARGELMLFLDADDRLAAGALTLLVEEYEASGADIVAGGFRKMSDGGLPAGNVAAFPGNRLLQRPDLVAYGFSYLRAPNRSLLFAYAWGRLFRADIIRGNGLLFNNTLHTFEDVDFNFVFLKYARAVSYIQDIVYEHRVYENYSSATMALGADPKLMFGYRRALESISGFLRESGAGPEVNAAVAHANVTLTIIQLVRICGQINAANKSALRGLVEIIVADPGLRGDLRFYSSSGGGSRLLPLLIKLRLPSLVGWVCRYKARKRYGKGD